MQAVGASLPEIDGRGLQNESAPVRRNGRVVPVAGGDFLQALFEVFAIRYRSGLAGDPGSETVSDGAAFVIGLGFFARNFRAKTAHAHLALQTVPEKGDGGPGVFLQFAAFAALVIGIESKSALIDSFEQDDARGRMAFRIDGGEGHGVRFREAGLNGGFKPVRKLLDRVGIEVAPAQPGKSVFFPQISDFHGQEFVAGEATGQDRGLLKNALILRPGRQFLRWDGPPPTVVPAE